jgi:hypothetical protein
MYVAEPTGILGMHLFLAHGSAECKCGGKCVSAGKLYCVAIIDWVQANRTDALLSPLDGVTAGQWPVKRLADALQSDLKSAPRRTPRFRGI